MRYDYVKKMAEAANQFSLVAQGQSNDVSGEVCISLTELQVSNAISDLKRREADVAIRY